MKPLPTSYNENEYVYTLIQRVGDIAMFRYTRDGALRGYEVVRVRKYADRVIMGNPSPAAEAIPPASSWGDEGWTFATAARGTDICKQQADARFAIEVAKNPNTEIIGGPTGKPRGRARNEFELDLDFTINLDNCEFAFADILAHYAGTDEAMLRNRLKALVDAGTVKLVRQVKIEGAKGKPRNIYTVA